MDNTELNERLMQIPGYIILVRKPADENLYGTVENSWSLGIEKGRAFFYWTNKEVQKEDGLDWANRDLETFRKNHPDWIFTVYDARDNESLPIVLNWPLWLDAHQRSDKTLSGVKNKHEARNLRFAIKGSPTAILMQSMCRELKTMVSTYTVLPELDPNDRRRQELSGEDILSPERSD